MPIHNLVGRIRFVSERRDFDILGIRGILRQIMRTTKNEWVFELLDDLQSGIRTVASSVIKPIMLFPETLLPSFSITISDSKREAAFTIKDAGRA